LPNLQVVCTENSVRIAGFLVMDASKPLMYDSESHAAEARRLWDLLRRLPFAISKQAHLLWARAGQEAPVLDYP
jgi:hypothetical protein